jgi:arsenite/tail-anchored protein-transporting ATPase
MERIGKGMPKNTYVVPWLAERPVEIEAVSALASLSKK